MFYFQKKILGPAGPQVFIFGRQNKTSVSVLVTKNYIYELMEYKYKLNILYLALIEKECFTLPLNFLLNSFRSILDYLPVFEKMNPHSSVNLLKQVFKQWNHTHLDKQTLGITRKLIQVIKEQNLQNLFCVLRICMFRNEHQ